MGEENNCSVSHNLFELYPTARHRADEKKTNWKVTLIAQHNLVSAFVVG